MKSPLKLAVTGAAGQIGYALVFRIASGEMFGWDQPLTLHLIEIPNALGALDGVVMELHDCAFPLLQSIVPTADLDEGFRDINWALLVGSIPRKAGMERKDLQRQNFHRARSGHREKCRSRCACTGDRKPLQHQLSDRDEQRKKHSARSLVRHDEAR